MTTIEPPRDFCIPEPGSTTFAGCYRSALRRLILEILNLGPAAASAADRRAELGRLAALLRRVKSDAPGALASLAASPNVGVFVRCLRTAPPGPRRDALAGELAATLAFELACAGLLREPFVSSAPPREIVAVGARRCATVEEGARRIEVLPGGEIRGADVTTHAFTPLAGGIALSTADANPLRMLEAHPDKQGNAVDLGGKTAAEWAQALASALVLIDAHLPAFRAEIDLVLKQFVPVGWSAETHLSASYQEALGTVYLSLHPSRLTMAEAIVHEVSHNKLNALLEIDPVIENDASERHASPVRPDPRPIHGVLLAVHAFLPVARLYERMATTATGAERSELERHLERVRAVNAEGAAVLLAHGRPTAVGRGLFDEIEREVTRYAS